MTALTQPTQDLEANVIRTDDTFQGTKICKSVVLDPPYHAAGQYCAFTHTSETEVWGWGRQVHG